MAYELYWGSNHPGHIVFLIDLSESMANKIDDVIGAMQNTCKSLVARCMAGRTLKERVSVSVYGYNCQITKLLKKTPSSIGDLATALKVSITENKPLFDKTKEAKTQGFANYRLAFEKSKNDIEQWIGEQITAGITNVPSPIVINITDGNISERDGEGLCITESMKAANDLTSLATKDGNVRLFNICFEVKSNKERLSFVKDYPQESNLQFLFNISSPMSEDMVESAKSYFGRVGPRLMFLSSGEVSAILKLMEQLYSS